MYTAALLLWQKVAQVGSDKTRKNQLKYQSGVNILKMNFPTYDWFCADGSQKFENTRVAKDFVCINKLCMRFS